MSTVALYVHGGRPEAVATSVALARWLTERDHRVVAPVDENRPAAIDDGPLVPDGDGERPDLVVAVGGDGTMLRATRRAVAADAHVLGVNLGRLGYLAEVEARAWEQALTDYFAGRHGVTERMLVTATLERSGRAPEVRLLPSALNEVVLEKQAMERTVDLAVSIDGELFTNYTADGIIIATPTGSTAYSLSARGPIVAPTHRALLLTAVSPHSLFDRSLVLEPTSAVSVTVLGDRSAAVAVDGERVDLLGPGDTVTATADPRPARFVTFGDRNFHQILKAKFGLHTR